MSGSEEDWGSLCERLLAGDRAAFATFNRLGSSFLSRLRAYVKRARDIPEVRRLCTRAFGPIPAVFVQADVCRDELLVELEGILVRKKEPS